MIGSIQGTIIDIEENKITIEANCIGYIIQILSPLKKDVGDDIQVWTYLAVRENSLDLYGFSNKFERSVFSVLLQVPKIGPKSALQILQKASIDVLLKSIQRKDPSGLSKKTGIGIKTAEKLVQALYGNNILNKHYFQTADINDTVNEEVTDTLIALGYPERKSHETLLKVKDEEPNIEDSKTLITKCLQKLSHN